MNDTSTVSVVLPCNICPAATSQICWNHSLATTLHAILRSIPTIQLPTSIPAATAQASVTSPCCSLSCLGLINSIVSPQSARSVARWLYPSPAPCGGSSSSAGMSVACAFPSTAPHCLALHPPSCACGMHTQERDGVPLL